MFYFFIGMKLTGFRKMDNRAMKIKHNKTKMEKNNVEYI